VSRRIGAAAGVPGFTSAMAIGEAMQALGTKRIALVSPYSEPVNASAKRYFEGNYGLSVVALEGFTATDSYAIGKLGPENAREAFARIDRPEIEAFVVPGGNFPTMSFIGEWEREFGKPVAGSYDYGAWWNYAFARMSGFSPAGSPAAAAHETQHKKSSVADVALTSFANRRDWQKFGEFYLDPESSGSLMGSAARRPVGRPACQGELAKAATRIGPSMWARRQRRAAS